MLSRVCMHAVVLNAKTVKITGLIRLESPGLVRDKCGVLTRVAKEEAFDITRKKFEEARQTKTTFRFPKNATHFAASRGITTAGFVSCGVRSLKMLNRLRERARVRVRLNLEVLIGSTQTTPNSLSSMFYSS